MHDALHQLADRALAGGQLGTAHAVRPQVVVHVPAATLISEPGTPGVPPAWLQDSRTPIPRGHPTAPRARETPRTGGRRPCRSRGGSGGRTGPQPMRARSDGRQGRDAARPADTASPGRPTPASATEGHHLDLWSRGGRTDIDDAALLCWWHHTYAHAHDIRIEKVPGGGLAFYTKTGTLIGITYPRRGPDPSLFAWPTAHDADDARPGRNTALQPPRQKPIRGPT